MVPGADDPCDPETSSPRQVLAPDWMPAASNDPAFRSGCEDCAEQIKNHIGGAVVTIKPQAPARLLGAFAGVNHGWRYHSVVVKDGRAYDAFTGSKGLGIADYLALWQYPDAIDFGFGP